jgi:cytochrome c biogenesis protein CcmG, thiol:disulfide interchange protein DsbE
MIDMVPVDELDDRTRRSRTLRVVIALIAIAAVITLVFLGLRPKEDLNTGGGPLPDFDLPRLSGEGGLSSTDLEGGPFVLNFWATWCNPCRKEMPAFERVWQRYKDDGLTIVGVNWRDDPAKARGFAEELGVTYPLVVDEDRALGNELGVNVGLPQTFFVDAEGDLFEGSAGSLGILTEEELEDRVQAMLEAQEASG